MNSSPARSCLIRLVARAVGTTLLVSLLLAPPSRAQGPATGSLGGRVSQTATRKVLESAVVTVVGTSYSTMTDARGEFLLPNLPPGDYTVRVSYTGLEDVEQSARVAAGRKAEVNVEMTSSIYVMGQFVVATEREGSAKAIQDQRYALNVKTMISADQFGGVADGTIDDALKRLPGIGYSTGEFSVRGIPGSVNAIEINGVRLASASGGADDPVGEDRSVKTSRIPGNNVESIEVVKALTPDRAADSVGGTINFITKSAFTSRERRIDASAGFTELGTLAQRARTGQVYSVSYSDTLNLGRGQKNLGVFFTAGYSDIDVPIDRPFRANEQLSGFHSSDPDVAPPYLTGIRLSNDLNPRQRYNAGLRLDYKLAAHSVVALDLAGNHEDLLVNSERERLFSSSTGSTPNILALENGVFVPVRSARNIAWVYKWTAVPTSIENIRQLQTTNGFNSALRGEHTRDRWKLNWHTTYSQDLGTYDQSHHGGGLRINNANPTDFQVDRSNSRYPAFTVIGGATPAYDDVTKAATSSPFTIQDKHAKSQIASASATLKREVAFLDTSFIQAGAAWRREKRFNDQNATLTYNYLGGADFTRFTGPLPAANPFGLYSHNKASNPALALADLRANPANWRLTSSADSILQGNEQSDGTVQEDVIAAYAMAVTKWQRFTLLAGVRDEVTRDRGTGTVVDQSKPSPARYTGRVTRTADYERVFPSAHLKYLVAPNVQGRLSYSTGIGRPGFGNIRPQTNVNPTSLTISQNNPGLKPQFSESLDATVEWYFRPAGALSVGLFRKDIFDYIQSTTTTLGADGGIFGPAFATYRFTTSSNVGSARVEGYEIDYRQQFTFLPGALRGLGGFANWTHLNTRANTNDGITQLATFIPNSANFGLSYLLGRMNVRVLGYYRSNYLLQYNANPYAAFYRQKSVEWDFKSTFRLNRHVLLYCDVANAFEAEPLNFASPYLTMDRIVYVNRRPRRFDFGLKTSW